MRIVQHRDLPRRVLARPAVDGGLVTSYLAVVVDLPTRTAAAAFDAAVGTVCGFVPGGGSTPGCVRSRYGALTGRGLWPAVAAELTLEPWDAASCELGVRPRHEVLVDPARRRVRGYLAAAQALLDDLGVAMAAWPLTAPGTPVVADVVGARRPVPALMPG